MNRFTIADLPLAGLKIVERQSRRDVRGWLSRIYCADELEMAGWYKPVAQITCTHTTSMGTIRGMHYQAPPHTEMKLVTCLCGTIWDVAVDLRRDSDTFLCWHAETLSAENHKAMLIPEGFAHGFQALTDDVKLLYCHSAAHAPTAEMGIRPTDPVLAITWPLPIGELSTRDRLHPLLGRDFAGLPR